MSKGIEGKFRAKGINVTFEKSATKETPMIVVHLQPIGEHVGNEVKSRDGLRPVKKPYFLGMNIRTQGKYAGKSGIEATREEFKETYDYEGALDEAAMSAHIAGKEVDIVCKLNDNGYTDVEWVNKIGQVRARKPIKPLNPDEVAAFNKEWGKSSGSAPSNASELFKKLTEGKQ